MRVGVGGKMTKNKTPNQKKQPKNPEQFTDQETSSDNYATWPQWNEEKI